MINSVENATVWIDNSTIEPEIAWTNCTRPGIEEFPKIVDLVLPWSLIVPAHIVVYSVILLVKVCDLHFIPSIKIICHGLGLGSDVAGATLMAAGVSSPDLFINLVGTFLTEGDIGVGTVLGCGVINTLLVPFLCVALSSSEEMRLRYWAVTRDCLFYSLSLGMLVWSLSDGRVTILESLLMVSLYLIYCIFMANNNWCKMRFESVLRRLRRRTLRSSQSLPLLMKSVSSTPYGLSDRGRQEERTFRSELLSWPEESSPWSRALFILGWPLDLVLYLTMPGTWRCSSLANGLTFCSCVAWIAITSYLVAWMITIMGFELGVPDSLMGLTFLALGMSVPESLTSIIVAKQGHGSMALGNVLGSSIFDVLACLGLPWLVKSLFFSSQGYVEINSKGLSLSTGLLFLLLLVLYLSLACNRFHLTMNIGLSCMVLYIVFLIFSSLIELNIFFVGNLPSCVFPT